MPTGVVLDYTLPMTSPLTTEQRRALGESAPTMDDLDRRLIALETEAENAKTNRFVIGVLGAVLVLITFLICGTIAALNGVA